MEQQATWPGWETVRLIGRGSFGTVYEIQRNVFDDVEKAALKVISIPQNASDIDEMYSDGYDDESITSTFQSHLKSIVAEYSLMRKMNGSANIVNCDDIRYIQHDDGIGWDIFIKMELLTPLTKSLPADIPEESVIKIAHDICSALELCKRHEIVHRDIKPQNIFVSPNGDYKLGDFGIAKTVEKTMGGTKIGTYKYMAPEVYNNQPYGSGADIYSLGLVLYWLLNERRMPFLPLPPAKLSTGMEEAARHRRFSGEPLSAPAHGSDALKAIVMKACAFDPKQRYSSASEMLADLKKLESGVVLIPPVMTTDMPAETVKQKTETVDIASDKANADDNESANVAAEEVNTMPAETVAEEVKVVPTKEKKMERIPAAAQEKPKKNWLFVVAGVLLVLLILLCLRFCNGNQGMPVNKPATTVLQPETTTTATSFVATDGETAYSYRIRVVDQNGNPIEGAQVMFCLARVSVYQTNAEGWVLINSEIAYGYRARIMSLPVGYKDYTFSEEFTYFESGQTEMTLVATKSVAVVVNVADYLADDSKWEDDGGYFTRDARKLFFDNFSAGDYAAVRLNEPYQNVTYKFNVTINKLAPVSMEDWTWWDSEFLVIARSAKAAYSWQDDGSQKGYTLTWWGNMSKVCIGRCGFDDAFGEFACNVGDGQTHSIELTVVNNDDGTVTLKLVLDGNLVAEVVDDGTKVKNERPALYPDAGGLTIRCKWLEATIN